MKILKNPLFTFILGVIITSGIVYAATKIQATEIEYAPNITVKDKIDDLYTKVKPEYTGSTEITPTTSNQVLNTNNKILKSNITVNKIPSTYKNLTTATTVTENDLLNGKTAYDNLGNLITGNISTDCVSGTHVWTQSDTNNGFVVTNYVPKYFAVTATNNNIRYIWYYNQNVNSNAFYSINSSQDATLGTITFSSTSSFRINNSLTLKWSASWAGKTLYYMVCK